VTAVIDAPTERAPAGATPGVGHAAPPSPSVRWLRRLWPVPAVLAVLAAITLVPGWGSSGPAPGEAFVSVDGSARVERVDGTVDVLVGGAGGARPARGTLHAGDRFDLVSGRAELELSGSVRMEAASSADLVMGRIPDLRSGDFLVTGDDSTSVSSGGTRVRFEGRGGEVAGRVTRTSGLSVGLYRGAARVDSAGTTRDLTALRRTDVPALGELTGVQPLRYDPTDAWDRRFLLDAITLDQELAEVLRGLVDSAQRVGGSPADLAQVLGGVEGIAPARELTRLVDPDRPLDDVVLGATISSLGRGGTFADRWRAALRFRDAGATWGLVALDRGVSAKAVLAALDGVVEATPLDFGRSAGTSGGSGSASGGAAGGGTTPATGGGAGAGSGNPGGGSGGGDGGGDGGGGTTTLPQVPTVPTTLPPVTVPPTTDVVGGILDGVGHTASTVVQGVGDTVHDVVNPPPPDDGPDCLLGVLCG
jgi:hypothetical protein